MHLVFKIVPVLESCYLKNFPLKETFIKPLPSSYEKRWGSGHGKSPKSATQWWGKWKTSILEMRQYMSFFENEEPLHTTDTIFFRWFLEYIWGKGR